MPNLRFTVDAEAIAEEFKNFKAEVQAAVEDGVKSLSVQTHAKILELASSKLSATRKIYTDNLNYEEVAPGIWVITLDKPAMWIEDGRKSGDMTEDMLRKNAKTAKDGSRYKVIPFDHGKPPSQMDPFSRNLVAKIKAEFKKANVPFKKLEYNQDGSPKLGKLHTFNFSSPYPSSRASHPALSGVTIYQNKGPNGKVKRDIMTFRVVSSKHKGNKWVHPGREASGFFEEALKWAEQEFESQILPEIYKRFDK